MSDSVPNQDVGGGTVSSSSGDRITTLDDAASKVKNNSSSDSESTSSSSPLLEGEKTFEELIGDICHGIDLIFAVKRSTVVVTDYETIFAEAKYLREKHNSVVEGEDIKLWQLEDGSYELDVSQYGYYNVVKVHYKNGVITESYEDLVKVYGKMIIEYYEKDLDKTSAQMKAKAYLAAHIRDFNMSIRANILWNGDLDVGDIVTIENPMTMRDHNRVDVEKRDPEYYFVKGESIEWEGNTPITGSLELTYGPESPEQKEIPETGVEYSKKKKASQKSTDIDSAVDEVGRKWNKMGYSSECQTFSCVQKTHRGDCWGCSDTIACELISRNVDVRILEYVTSSSDQHRSVQYKNNHGKWINFPYRKYGFSQLFNDTSNVVTGHEIKCTCKKRN